MFINSGINVEQIITDRRDDWWKFNPNRVRVDGWKLEEINNEIPQKTDVAVEYLYFGADKPICVVNQGTEEHSIRLCVNQMHSDVIKTTIQSEKRESETDLPPIQL